MASNFFPNDGCAIVYCISWLSISIFRLKVTIIQFEIAFTSYIWIFLVGGGGGRHLLFFFEEKPILVISMIPNCKVNLGVGEMGFMLFCDLQVSLKHPIGDINSANLHCLTSVLPGDTSD